MTVLKQAIFMQSKLTSQEEINSGEAVIANDGR
jgi:hypothetical protein